MCKGEEYDTWDGNPPPDPIWDAQVLCGRVMKDYAVWVVNTNNDGVFAPAMRNAVWNQLKEKHGASNINCRAVLRGI